MRLHTFITMFLVVSLFPISLLAAAQEDVRGISLRQQGNKVIDDKCLACHNRQKIEAAQKARKNMENITRRMEKKGVVLSDRDRQVLGHFWQQNPLKKVK